MIPKILMYRSPKLFFVSFLFPCTQVFSRSLFLSFSHLPLFIPSSSFFFLHQPSLLPKSLSFHFPLFIFIGIYFLSFPSPHTELSVLTRWPCTHYRSTQQNKRASWDLCALFPFSIQASALSLTCPKVSLFHASLLFTII